MTIAVTIERAAIRATPGGDVVRSVPAGTTVAVEADLGAWYKVIAVEGSAQAGYINGRSIKITATTPPPPPPPPPVDPAPVTGAVHTIHVRTDGTLSVDGLDYE